MNKELKEIKYCSIYLQVFFISDIPNLEGNKIEEWAGCCQRQVGRQSTWDWPIQQRSIAWKACKMALEHLTPNGCELFGVGYHSRVGSTNHEQVLLSGGGPDDGDPSHRSELRGAVSGIAVIGTLVRSGKTKVK
jgi:hypothetical protein